MNCSHPNQSTYHFALGRKTTALCADCLAKCEALGMTFRLADRRTTDITPMVERRDTRPAWLDRLTARDESGRNVA